VREEGALCSPLLAWPDQIPAHALDNVRKLNILPAITMTWALDTLSVRELGNLASDWTKTCAALQQRLPKLRRLEPTFLDDFWCNSSQDSVAFAAEVRLMRLLAEMTHVKVVPVAAESDRHIVWQLKAYGGSKGKARCMEAWDEILENAKQVDQALDEEEDDSEVEDEEE